MKKLCVSCLVFGVSITWASALLIAGRSISAFAVLYIVLGLIVLILISKEDSPK